MPYVSSVERLARKEGVAQGKADMLLKFLKGRFPGKITADLDAIIRGTTDLAKLEQWGDLVMQVASMEEFRQLGQL